MFLSESPVFSWLRLSKLPSNRRASQSRAQDWSISSSGVVDLAGNGDIDGMNLSTNGSEGVGYVSIKKDTGMYRFFEEAES